MRSRPTTGAPAARSASCGSSEEVCRFERGLSPRLSGRKSLATDPSEARRGRRSRRPHAALRRPRRPRFPTAVRGENSRAPPNPDMTAGQAGGGCEISPVRRFRGRPPVRRPAASGRRGPDLAVPPGPEIRTADRRQRMDDGLNGLAKAAGDGSLPNGVVGNGEPRIERLGPEVRRTKPENSCRIPASGCPRAGPRSPVQGLRRRNRPPPRCGLIRHSWSAGRRKAPPDPRPRRPGHRASPGRDRTRPKREAPPPETRASSPRPKGKAQEVAEACSRLIGNGIVCCAAGQMERRPATKKQGKACGASSPLARRRRRHASTCSANTMSPTRSGPSTPPLAQHPGPAG